MVDVVPAVELGARHRRLLVELYLDAFGADFRWFATDPRRLADAFEHMLVPELFHVAVLDGEPAGLAARTDGRQQSVRPRLWPLLRRLGPIRGGIGGIMLRREFSGSLDLPPGTASLEFVGTAAAHRSSGVATALLEHLMRHSDCTAFVLEDIADVNTAALNLYRKLGFVEYRRRPVPHTARTGIGAYVSMRLDRGAPAG